MISIIVPVYNSDKFLKRCLESIVSQIYTDLEIILIDDGSTDQSSLICDEFAAQDERIVVVHKKNEGVVKTRNLGLEIAKGEFIGFIDSDDYILPDMYQYLIDIMDSTGADIACCGISRRYKKSNKKFDTKSFSGTRIYDKEEALYRFQLGDDISVTVWNKIFKASVLKELEFENYGRLDDARFVCKAIEKSDLVAFGSEAKYIYEIRDNSITQSGFNKSTYDILKVTDENYDSIKKANNNRFNYSIGRIVWYIVFSNEMIKGKKVDHQVIIKLKKMIHENWNYIKKCDDFGFERKAQIFMIANCFFVYSIVYKLYCKFYGK